MNRFIRDIETKWKNSKEFLISELGVGQGTATPKDFIDPLPIIEALEKFEEKLAIDLPLKEINENFWQVRFGSVAKLGAYAEFHKGLEGEIKAISDSLAMLKEFLIACGFVDNDLKKELRTCVAEIVELIEIQKENLSYPDLPFDNLWESNRLMKNREDWSISVGKAAKVIANPSNIDILCFDPSSLKEAQHDLVYVTKQHLELIEKELSGQEKPGGGENAGTKEDFLNELKQISEILITPEKKNSED